MALDRRTGGTSSLPAVLRGKKLGWRGLESLPRPLRKGTVHLERKGEERGWRSVRMTPRS